MLSLVLGCLSSPDIWGHHLLVFIGSSKLYPPLDFSDLSDPRVPEEVKIFSLQCPRFLCLDLRSKGPLPVFPNLLNTRNWCYVVMTLNLEPKLPGSYLLPPLSTHRIKNKLSTTQILNLHICVLFLTPLFTESNHETACSISLWVCVFSQKPEQKYLPVITSSLSFFLPSPSVSAMHHSSINKCTKMPSCV